jgi:flagellar basal body-associated protein FliL
MPVKKRRAPKRQTYSRKKTAARGIIILVILLILLIIIVVLTLYAFPILSQKKIFTSQSGKHYTPKEAYIKQIHKKGKLFGYK